MGLHTSEAILAGMGMATLLLLTANLAEGYDAASATVMETLGFYWTAAGLLVMGLISNILLLWSVPFVGVVFQQMEKSLGIRDSSLLFGLLDETQEQEDDEEVFNPPPPTPSYALSDMEAIGGSGKWNDDDYHMSGGSSIQSNANTNINNNDTVTYGLVSSDTQIHDISQAQKKNKPFQQIAKEIYASIVLSALSAITLVGVSAVLPLIQPVIQGNHITTVIMYINALSTFCGNLICLKEEKMAQHPRVALTTAGLRVFVFGFIIIYALAGLTWSDYLIMSMVAIHSATGAYLNSVAYQLVGNTVKQKEQSQATMVLNICLYASYDVGAVISLLALIVFNK